MHLCLVATFAQPNVPGRLAIKAWEMGKLTLATYWQMVSKLEDIDIPLDDLGIKLAKKPVFCWWVGMNLGDFGKKRASLLNEGLV